MDDENAVKVAKKQRGNHLEESISMPEPEPTKRGGRTRRAQRSKLEMEVQEKAAPILCEDDAVIVLDDVLLGDDTVEKGELAKRAVYRQNDSRGKLDNRQMTTSC